MTLDEWAENERLRLEEFVKNYKLENKEDPKHWPITMNQGDWDEQYEMLE